MVVEPAQRGEVLRFVGTAPRSRNDVVGFEPVPGRAAPDAAAPVAMCDETPHGGWYHSSRLGCGDGLPVRQADDLDGPGAQQLLERVGPHPGPVLDRAAGFAAGPARLIEVDEHSDLRTR